MSDAPPLAQTLIRLRKMVSENDNRLRLLDEDSVGRPTKEGGWNGKQILGHLIDSASNNHQRFVRALIQGELDFPSYTQEVWVRTQYYAAAEWSNLVSLWTSFNSHLLWIIAQIPEDKAAIPCRIGGKGAISLSELINSYADHMEHHLDQLSKINGVVKAD